LADRNPVEMPMASVIPAGLLSRFESSSPVQLGGGIEASRRGDAISFSTGVRVGLNESGRITYITDGRGGPDGRALAEILVAGGLLPGAAARLLRFRAAEAGARDNPTHSQSADGMTPSQRDPVLAIRNAYGPDGAGDVDSNRNGERLSMDRPGAQASPERTPVELALRRAEVERELLLEIAGEEARDASLTPAQQLLMGGPARSGSRGGSTLELVRNGNWDAALNIGADPLGLLGDLPGLQSDLSRLSRANAEARIDQMRQAMMDAGVKALPSGYRQAWVSGSDGVGRTVNDYAGTVEQLRTVYEGHVRDQRLRETWGDDHPNVRLGKSRMTVTEF
jgi:hypothetical protein